MTLFPGSGLLKRIEAPEGHLALGPEVGRVAEDVEQLLARLAIEAGIVGQLLENDDEAGLRPGLVDQIGHAIKEGIEVLAEVGGKRKRFGNRFKHVLLRLRHSQISIKKVLIDMPRRLHQVVDTIGPYRLHDIRTDCLQEHVAFLLF